MSFPKPTAEELKQIKELMVNPDGVDDSKIGVVRQLMADNNITSYGTTLSKQILSNFVGNIKSPTGATRVPLMFNHPSLAESLPLGTSFDAVLKESKDEFSDTGEPLIEVFGSFYTVDGQETVALGGFWDKTIIPVKTEDIGTKYSAGQIRSGSVGFYTQYAICNICGLKHTDENCEHAPGKKYNGKMCAIVMGIDSLDAKKSDGYLREYSLVTAGAVKNAGAVQSYSYSEPDKEKGFTYQFATDKPLQRLGGDDCGNNNVRTEGSTKTTQKEMNMPVTLETAEYKDLLKNEIKLSDSASEVERLNVLVTELQADSKKFSASEEKIIALTAEKEELSKGHTSFIEAVVASGIKAYGAGKDDNADKYAEMSPTELTAAYEANVVAYCDALKIGETTDSGQSNETEKTNTYSSAQRVAASMQR